MVTIYKDKGLQARDWSLEDSRPGTTRRDTYATTRRALYHQAMNLVRLLCLWSVGGGVGPEASDCAEKENSPKTLGSLEYLFSRPLAAGKERLICRLGVASSSANGSSQDSRCSGLCNEPCDATAGGVEVCDDPRASSHDPDCKRCTVLFIMSNGLWISPAALESSARGRPAVFRCTSQLPPDSGSMFAANDSKRSPRSVWYIWLSASKAL